MDRGSHRRFCDKADTAQFHAFCADYVFGGFFDLANAAPQHDHLHAVMLIKVDMHQANRLQQT